MSIKNNINENGWISDLFIKSCIFFHKLIFSKSARPECFCTAIYCSAKMYRRIGFKKNFIKDALSQFILRYIRLRQGFAGHSGRAVKIKQYNQSLLFSFSLFLLFSSQIIIPFTVMIDPSGDAKHTGRVIQDTFERGITLQCAELLKKELNKAAPDVRVVLTRVPGETIQPLQNASFANRLQADLYLSISFYLETDIPSHITLFQYITTQTDYWHKYSPLCFYHVSQAHLINVGLTTLLGKKLLKLLETNSINSFFLPQGLFAIPYKPLVGIKAPALAIEAGINQKDDFKYIVKPLVAFICEIAS